MCSFFKHLNLSKRELFSVPILSVTPQKVVLIPLTSLPYSILVLFYPNTFYFYSKTIKDLPSLLQQCTKREKLGLKKLAEIDRKLKEENEG